MRVLDAAVGIPTLADLTRPEHNLIPKAPVTLTVIVPARNEEAKVRACLESLLAQDYAVQNPCRRRPFHGCDRCHHGLVD